LLNMHFDSVEEGWVQVEYPSGLSFVESIFRTNDGGKTWREQPPLPGEDMVVYAKNFTSGGMVGWVGGAKRPPSTRRISIVPGCISPPDISVLEPAIFHTIDGGRHWTQQLLPEPGGCPVGKLFFQSAQVGVAGAGHHVYFTLNAGTTWQASDFPKDCTDREWLSSEWNEPLSFFFYDRKVGWLSSLDGFLLRTMDGGKSWCTMKGPLDLAGVPMGVIDFATVHFSSVQHGWLLGGDQRVYETVDGGSRWSRVEGADSVYSLFCRESRCWALSKNNLYRTNPQGP